jgi:hypothetical protein
MPKFLIMVNHDNGVMDDVPMDEWKPEEVAAHMNYYEVLGCELDESGEQIQFMALADPRLARIVRSDGKSAPVVTGPAPSRSPPACRPCPAPAASPSSSQSRSARS